MNTVRKHQSGSTRTWFARDFDGIDLDVVAAKKQLSRVSVVIPALNEGATITEIVRRIRGHAVDGRPLVDELIVSVDAETNDDTAELARAAGAEVVTASAGTATNGGGGKGATMWRGLSRCTGEIVCFHDADLTKYSDGFVPRLIWPLLLDDEIDLVKGFYDRGPEPSRVTEFVARPLLALMFPELAGVIEPLAGEYAMRATVANSLEFAGGYGVDLGLLLDVYRRRGPSAIGQVELGVRFGRRHGTDRIRLMAAEVLQAALHRLPESIPEHQPVLQWFTRAEGEWRHEFRELPTTVAVPPERHVRPA